MQTPQPPPSPSPSPASPFQRGSANERSDHMADYPEGSTNKFSAPLVHQEFLGEGLDRPARDIVTTPDQVPIQPVQGDYHVWNQAGSFIVGVGTSGVGSTSSEVNIRSSIDSPQGRLWPTESDWNPCYGRGLEASAPATGGSIAADAQAGIPLGTIEALDQNSSIIPQALISNGFHGQQNIPPTMGVPNVYHDTQFECTHFQAAVGLPNGHQVYPVQSQMNWSNNSGHNLGQTTSMQPFPASPNNLTNAGTPFGFPVYQRTPCTWTMCSESFARQSDLQRHVESVHLGIKYHCFWPSCPNNRGNGYCRLEKLRTHQKQKHGYALA